MIETNELFALILATGVLVLLYIIRDELRQLPSFSLLLLSYAVLYLGFIFTILEGFAFYDLFNTLEHLCNNLSILGFVAWVWVHKPDVGSAA